MRKIPNFRPLLARAVLISVVIACVSGCAQTVEVKTDFPDPLVDSLPLKVGMRYSQQFLEYRYSEDLPDDVSWSFSIGESNRKLFDKIFTTLMEQAVEVGDDDSLEGFDAIIEPSVVALEFSLPRQSRSDQYAVWIRYMLKVLDTDGQLISELPISAYGQSDSKLLNGDDSMRQATIRAMRDAAVSIIVSFSKDEKIRQALLELPGEETLEDPAEETAEKATEEPPEETLDGNS
jgi:hypothetical protein